MVLRIGVMPNGEIVAAEIVGLSEVRSCALAALKQSPLPSWKGKSVGFSVPLTLIHQ